MKLLAILPLLLIASPASAFSLRGTGNYTLQQQQEKDSAVYSRIFHGLPAKHLQFPYQVGLRIFLAGDETGDCSGSLISPVWVLTTAHCLEDGKSVDVYLGNLQFAATNIKYHIHMHDTREHRSYKKKTLKHDIALIKIPSVRLSEAVNTILLPRSIGNLPSYAGAVTVLAGWGRTSDSSMDTSIMLKYARFRVIPNDECTKTYGNDSIYPGKLCTDTTYWTSACKGDSGTPLVFVNSDKQAIQIGILSFVHSRGCELGYPNAFTRTDYYLGWINGKTGIDFKP